jgi:tripartite ATP-independent transporter DctM subunit
MGELIPLLMFLSTFAVLLLGFPVAFSLAGIAIIFASVGYIFGVFDMLFLAAIPERIFGIMLNETLLAVPLFVFMGVMLERSKISEDLLETMAKLFGNVKGGLGVSICIVGGLLAASTGIVGATVVTMGLISLPVMLKRKYDPSLSCGVICASGTLGQIIPPSIILVILGDVMSTAHQQAQISMGVFVTSTVSVADLFVGAIVPGALLMGLYILYVLVMGWLRPEYAPVVAHEGSRLNVAFLKQIGKALVPPLLLIVGVLGSILGGVATPTEAASVGCVGALGLTHIKSQLNLKVIKLVMQSTAKITTMVFCILIGASIFSLVFRGYEGDEWVRTFLLGLGGDVSMTFWMVMGVMFLMGFFLDFFEITFVVVPIVGPILLSMGLDPVWLGVMIAMNLQTSFLTPPFGFSLFYLRGVAPKTVSTTQIYKGVIPFISIQVFVMTVLWIWPELVTWLPKIFL